MRALKLSSDKCEIDTGNGISLTFIKVKNNSGKTVVRFTGATSWAKSRLYSNSDLWVEKPVFAKAIRMAAAAMRSFAKREAKKQAWDDIQLKLL